MKTLVRARERIRGLSYLVSPTRKVVFSAIPKAGVESIRFLILREEGEREPHRIWDPRADKYNPVIRREFPKDYAYIVIVRSPYRRLVSGYVDKFLTGNFHLLAFCKTVMRWYRRSMDDRRRVSFEEFVDFLVSQPPYRVDPHFRPQTALFRMTDRARIFKLEENGIQDALDRLGFEQPFVNYRAHYLYSFQVRHVPGAHRQYYEDFDIAECRPTPVDPPHAAGVGFEGAMVPLFTDFYTDESRNRVYNYYRDDFETLGYAPVLSPWISTDECIQGPGETTPHRGEDTRRCGQ